MYHVGTPSRARHRPAAGGYAAADMRLATFLPPGSQAPRAGEVRGDHVAAYPFGMTVLDQLTER